MLRFFLVLLVFGLEFARAQSVTSPKESAFFTRYFQLGDELQRNSINSIVFDEFGFLWIATKNGLFRHDGTNFQRFRQDINDSLSIPDNFVRDLKRVPGNKLVAVTDKGGAGFFDVKECSYSAFDFSDVEPSEIPTRYYSAFILSDESILLATEQGVWKINPVTLKAKKWNHEIPFFTGSVRTIFQSADSSLWFGSLGSGVLKLDQTGKAEHIDLSVYENPLIWNMIEVDQEIWMASQGWGILSYNKKTKQITRISVNGKKPLQDRILALAKSPFASMEVFAGGWENGLYSLHSFTGESKSVVLKPGLEEMSVLFLQSDEHGLWIGTESEGLIYLRKEVNGFTVLEESNSGMKSNLTRKILAVNDSTFLLGTILNGLQTVRSSDFSNIETAFPEKLSKANITDLKWIDYPKTIGIASFDDGVWIWDVSKHRFSQLKWSENGSIGGVQSLFRADSSVYFASTQKGLIKTDLHGENPVFYNSETQKELSVNYDKLRLIKPYNERFLWIGSMLSGLFLFDTKTQHYHPDITQNLKLSGFLTNDLVKDKTGNWWLALENSGITVWNPESNKTEYISEENGLINDNVQSLNVDSNGKIWMFTTYGFSVIEPAIQYVHSFKRKRDIPFDFFYRESLFEFNDSTWYAPADGGILKINPSAIKKQKNLPRLYLSKLETGSKTLDFADLNPQKDPLVIPYTDRSVRFSVSAPQFYETNIQGFEYRLVGSDITWTKQTGFEPIIVNNLSSGSYELQVRATGQLLQEVIPVQKFEFEIGFPFWRQYWFYGLIALLISTVLYVIYSQYQKRKAALEQLRVQIASDLHDEIGASLTKISIQAGLLSVEQKPDGMIGRIKKIEDSSREIIRLMSDIIWAIDSRKDTVEDLINRMKETAFDLFEDQTIQFEFDEQVQSKQRVLPLKTRETLFLVYKEAITNSVKHSSCSKIQVQLKMDSKSYSLWIKDDGQGFDGKNPERAGNGLKNMEMRAKRVNARFTIKNQQGTLVQLSGELPKIPYLWD
ncbi:hypothetical protein EP331_13980 [bacterium]|nr:MAG: hypothetical protein EP331_13980 [bacterium]